MVSVGLPNEWFLPAEQSLCGREGSRRRGLPGEELGRCRVLGGRLREPRVSELGAVGWWSVGLPNEWCLQVEESLRGRGGEQAPRVAW